MKIDQFVGDKRKVTVLNHGRTSKLIDKYVGLGSFFPVDRALKQPVIPALCAVTKTAKLCFGK